MLTKPKRENSREGARAFARDSMSGGHLVEGLARVDALDDFLDGLVLDEQVAYFNRRENLADQVSGREAATIKTNAEGHLIHRFDLQSIALECKKAGGLLLVAQHE